MSLMNTIRTALAIAAILSAGRLGAQPPADDTAAQLAKSLKPILSSAIPETLFENSENWGHTVMVPVGLKWRGFRASVTKSPREHGEWKKLIICTQKKKRKNGDTQKNKQKQKKTTHT